MGAKGWQQGSARWECSPSSGAASPAPACSPRREGPPWRRAPWRCSVALLPVAEEWGEGVNWERIGGDCASQLHVVKTCSEGEGLEHEHRRARVVDASCRRLGTSPHPTHKREPHDTLRSKVSTYLLTYLPELCKSAIAPRATPPRCWRDAAWRGDLTPLYPTRHRDARRIRGENGS